MNHPVRRDAPTADRVLVRRGVILCPRGELRTNHTPHAVLKMAM
jgi:hypothetical protein